MGYSNVRLKFSCPKCYAFPGHPCFDLRPSIESYQTGRRFFKAVPHKERGKRTRKTP